MTLLCMILFSVYERTKRLLEPKWPSVVSLPFSNARVEYSCLLNAADEHLACFLLCTRGCWPFALSTSPLITTHALERLGKYLTESDCYGSLHLFRDWGYVMCLCEGFRGNARGACSRGYLEVVIDNFLVLPTILSRVRIRFLRTRRRIQGQFWFYIGASASVAWASRWYWSRLEG